jgi:HK97 family phage portal protein
MGILNKLQQYVPIELKAAQLSLTEISGWQPMDLLRRNSRIYYSPDSAFQAYRSHELVYACINKIADVMNDVEIVVEKKNGKGEWGKVEGHALPGLLKRPNNYQTGRDFRRLLVQSEQSAGRFYIAINRSQAGLPAELVILNPNRIVARKAANNIDIAFYEYQRDGASPVRIRPEDLLIRRRADLLDQFNGFSPLAAALKSINSDLGLTDYVDAFFESDGTPSGILKLKNVTISDTRKEALQAQWRQKYSRGGSNQKGLAVLDEQADYQKIGSNLDELASDELSGRFESRICAVFGVPPNLVGAYVGLQHVTANATAKAELRNFWDNKINGELAAFREWATWFVLPEFENFDDIRAEKIRVGFDLSQCAFLQDDVDGVHARARENFKAGIWTLNETREQTGMPPDKDAKDDYYIQPNTHTAITAALRAQEAAEEPEPVPNQLEPGDPATDPDDNEDPEDAGKAHAEHLEKKTFDLDGLTLGREPRGVETLIDLKKIAGDQESEKQRLIKIFGRFRSDLIKQAGEKLESLEPANAHELTLQPDPDARKLILKALRPAEKAAELGYRVLFTKDLDDDEDLESFLDRLTDLSISRIINEIQKRAVTWFTMLRLLGSYTVDQLLEKLTGESTKWLEQEAANAANISIQYGRDAEINNNLDQIDRCEYSAILDANTCGPCEEADGLTGATPDDLPDAPNPDCEGGSNCRCFIIGVII